MTKDPREGLTVCTDVVKGVRDAYQDNLKTMHAAGLDIGMERGLDIGMERGLDIGMERGRAAAARDLVRQAVADHGALSPSAWAEYRSVLDGLPVHQIPNAIAVTTRLLAYPAVQRSDVAWDILNEARALPAPLDPEPAPDADTDG